MVTIGNILFKISIFYPCEHVSILKLVALSQLKPSIAASMAVESPCSHAVIM